MSVYDQLRSYLPGPRVVALVVGLLTVFSFQNCSQNYDLASSDNVNGLGSSLLRTSQIRIQNGAAFTNLQDVSVQLDSPDSREVLLTSDPNCEPLSGEVWAPISNEKIWRLTALNQTSKVYARFRTTPGDLGKKVALESGCVSAEIIHDSIAPQLSWVDRPGQVIGANSLQMRVRAMDVNSIAKLECRLVDPVRPAGLSSNCLEDIMLSDLNDGANVISVIAEDLAGNRSPAAQASFFVDLTDPSVQLVAPIPARTLTSGNVSFRFQVNDNYRADLAARECRLEQMNGVVVRDWQACSMPNQQNYSGLADNSYRFRLRVEDLVGRTNELSYDFSVASTPGSRFQILGITSDVTLPVRDADIDNVLGVRPQPQLHWTASNGADSYVVAIWSANGMNHICANQTVPARAATTFVFPNNCALVHGQSYQARVYSYTQSGVERAADNVLTFSVDLQGPDFPTLGPVALTRAMAEVPFTVTDSGTGVVNRLRCEHYVNGNLESEIDCRGQARFQATGMRHRPGNHSLRLRAVDSASNETASGQINWVVEAVDCSSVDLMDCPLVADRFERASVVENSDLNPWRQLIDSNGSAGSALDAGIYQDTHVGPLVSGSSRALVLTGHGQNPPPYQYLISKTQDLAAYRSLRFGFDILSISLAAGEHFAIDVCNSSPTDCGVGSSLNLSRLNNASRWTQVFVIDGPANGDLNGHNHDVTRWQSVAPTFDLTSIPQAARDNFVFRVRYRMNGGWSSAPGGFPNPASNLDDGVLIDNFSVRALKP